MANEWTPFPLLIFEYSAREKFVLPTERDLTTAQEAIDRTIDDLRIARERNSVKRAEFLEMQLEASETNLERLKNTIAKLTPKAKVKDYSLGYVDFSEYTKAEEDSKDWLNTNDSRINEAKLALNLLGNHVKLGDIILDKNQVGKLAYNEIQALYQEVRAMTFPNPDRLPFLNLLSETP